MRVFHVVFPRWGCEGGNDSRNEVGGGIIAGRDFDDSILLLYRWSSSNVKKLKKFNGYSLKSWNEIWNCSM